MKKVIGLIDCDSFFVSCECVDNGSLKNKPVCVMGGGARGIIISRSKEAKQVGVKMGQPYFQVKVDFPNVLCIEARHERYKALSNQVMETLREFSPDVEVMSIDEAFIDLTGMNKLYRKKYPEIVQDIRTRLLDKVGIPVSVGLATSKTLAKLACDKAKKTNGFFMISPAQILETIGADSVRVVSGIGPNNAAHLQANHVYTIADLIALEDTKVRTFLGAPGIDLKYELMGQCISPVSSIQEAPKSIQDTSVLPDFTSDINILRSSINYHIHQACRRLRRWKGYCACVGVMLRTKKEFKVLFVRHKLKDRTNCEKDISIMAQHLLDKIYDPSFLYRSCGIALEELSYPDTYQLSLFDEPASKEENLTAAIDALETKFGRNIIKTGWM